MSSFVGKIHDWKYSKWVDPVGYYSQDLAHKSSTGIVNESSRAMEKVGNKWGIDTKIPRYGKDLSQKDKNSFGRWGENTAGVAALVYGGMSALGGEAGGAAGGSGAGAGGAGTYLEAGGGVVADTGGGGFAWNGIGAEGGAGSTGALGQGGGWQWGNMMKQGGSTMQNMGQAQQAPKDEVDESDVQFERPDYEGDPYAYSSKRLKGNPRSSMREVMRRGAAGADVIDQNGVHMAAIQALTKKVIEAQARVEQLKGKRA